MREIKCSRCRYKRPVPDDWRWKECPKCHERTVKRLKTIVAYKHSDFDVRTLFEFPSFEQYINFTLRNRGKKRMSKAEHESLKKQWIQMKADHDRENAAKIARLDATFAIKKYPMHSKDCFDIRIQALRHYQGNERWDTFAVDKHILKCPHCNGFVRDVKFGFFIGEKPSEPEAEKDLSKEGYVSLKEWQGLMDDFGKVVQEDDPYERPFFGLKDCCLNCGQVKVNGKCPVCNI